MIQKALQELPLVFTAVAASFLCSACGNPQMEDNLQRRVDNLNKTAGWAIESEKARPGKPEKTANVIQWQYEHDVQKAFVDNPATAQQWTKEEFDRWQDRQPAYRKNILDELDGNLISLEQTIPKIID